MQSLHVMKKELLDLIYEKIRSGMSPGCHDGLLGGKMGVALFLYAYSWLKKSTEVQKEADRTLEDLWNSIHGNDISNGFLTGRPGIAWGLLDLGRKGFLELSDGLKPYMAHTDFYVYKEQKTESPVLIDPESGLFAAGIYHVAHDSDSLGRFYWREEAIYLIEDCERLLCKSTSYQNLFLPEMTLKLLNSMLFFLIEMHRQVVYPCKTTGLIEEAFLQIRTLAGSAPMQEVIVAKCLLDTMDGFAGSLYHNQTIERPEDIIACLSEAGFYALLYHQKTIIEECFSYCAGHDPQVLNTVYEKLKEERIPMKTLLGTGYGLLMMLEDEED